MGSLCQKNRLIKASKTNTNAMPQPIVSGDLNQYVESQKTKHIKKNKARKLGITIPIYNLSSFLSMGNS